MSETPPQPPTTSKSEETQQQRQPVTEGTKDPIRELLDGLQSVQPDPFPVR